jgi:hypothetical protein
VGRKFNPGVPEMMAEARTVARELRFGDQLVGGTKVAWLIREPGPPPHFSLYDDEARLLGRAKHVLVAIGHGPLSFPGALGKAREDPATADRIVQAYERKSYYPGGRYVVLGSGIAAVNEWVNILDAGAECIALRRNPQPEEQDLNVPRCLFDGSGIDAFGGLTFDQRVDFLAKVLKGTSPQRRSWAATVKQGLEQNRFEEVIGNVAEIQAGPAGLIVDLEVHGGGRVRLDATGIVSSSGFVKSALSLPLLRRLAQTYAVPVEHERIRIKTNCGIPPLDREDSRLCLIGLNANTVVPNGDTIAGLKYISRRFVGDVARAEGLTYRSLPGRLAMQMRLARRSAGEIRRLDKTAQLA